MDVLPLVSIKKDNTTCKKDTRKNSTVYVMENYANTNPKTQHRSIFLCIRKNKVFLAYLFLFDMVNNIKLP